MRLGEDAQRGVGISEAIVGDEARSSAAPHVESQGHPHTVIQGAVHTVIQPRCDQGLSLGAAQRMIQVLHTPIPIQAHC